MRKTSLRVVTIFLVVAVVIANLAIVQAASSQSIGNELISDGAFSNFKVNGQGNSITMAKFPDFNLQGMCTFANDGNSVANVVKNGGNAMAQLTYDGSSSGDNSNIWMIVPSIKAGAGNYSVSFDLQCSGLSAGDYFGISLIGPNSALNIDGIPLINSLSDYTGTTNLSKDYGMGAISKYAISVSNSTKNSGWKHFSVTVPQTAAQAANNDTLTFNLYNKKNKGIVANIDNISVNRGGKELAINSSGDYVGDFNCYFSSTIVLGKSGPVNGYGCALANESAPAVISENSNNVLKMGFDGVSGHNMSSFYKMMDFGGAGSYLVSFDIKYSNALNTDNIGVHFAGPSTTSPDVPIASSKSDLDSLESSTALKGYKHFSASLELDTLSSEMVDSLAIWFNTKGVSSTTNWIQIDNLSVKQVSALTKKEKPSTEGLYQNILVHGGDFEKQSDNAFSEGYSFVAEPDMSSYFWGTAALNDWYDCPAVITSVKDSTGTDSQAMLLQYDGKNTTAFSTAFVMLDVSRINTDDTYVLSFDYKAELKGGKAIGPLLHVEFTGPTGVENYKMYLGYTDSKHLFTNGSNEQVYPFTVTDKGNGWTNVSLTMQMNNYFIANVDSIRFTFDTQKDASNKVYFDNVVFDDYSITKFEEPTIVAPTETDDNSSDTQVKDSSKLPVWVIIVIVAVVLALAGGGAAFFIIKKKKATKTDESDLEKTDDNNEVESDSNDTDKDEK